MFSADYIKIKTLYIKYCTCYKNKFNHESWLLKHISSSLEMIWSYNYIFFFLIKFDTCIWSPHYGNAFIFIYINLFFCSNISEDFSLHCNFIYLIIYIMMQLKTKACIRQGCSLSSLSYILSALI